MINTLNIEYILLLLIYIYLIFFVDLNNNTKILFTIIIILLCTNKFIKNNKLLETYELINKLTMEKIDKLKEKENKGFNDFVEYTFDGDDDRNLYLNNLKNYEIIEEELKQKYDKQYIDIEKEYDNYLDQIDDEIDAIDDEFNIEESVLLTNIQGKLQNDRKMTERDKILHLAKNKRKYETDLTKEENIYSKKKDKNNRNRLFNKMIGKQILTTLDKCSTN